MAGTSESIIALEFYLIVYALSTLGSFAILAHLDHHSTGVSLQDLRGLFSRSPWLAGTFTICLLTLAGFPPTVGFLAKLYIFKVAFQSGYEFLVIVGLLTTILSAFYYLRIISIMFAESSIETTPIVRSGFATAVGILVVMAILLFSCFPEPLIAYLN